jgi:hypothetical protein
MIFQYATTTIKSGFRSLNFAKNSSFHLSFSGCKTCKFFCFANVFIAVSSISCFLQTFLSGWLTTKETSTLSKIQAKIFLEKLPVQKNTIFIQILK